MHILETYALLSGTKIRKCYIREEKIDLPKTKYITFHGHSPKGNSKQYKFWPNVLAMLGSNPEFNYEIIQIGSKDDVKYDVNTEYLGKTNYHSLAYLIKHCELHLGFDSFPIHLASHYDKKIVGLYSYYSNTCGPYFSNKENITIFEPNWNITKPTFSHDDPFDLINTIDYLAVYTAVCELLL